MTDRTAHYLKDCAQALADRPYSYRVASDGSSLRWFSGEDIAHEASVAFLGDIIGIVYEAQEVFMVCRDGEPREFHALTGADDLKLRCEQEMRALDEATP